MSTYSSNLRIELITTGTQAGTWGDTTNSNYQYVMEAAIAGYIAVTTSAANEALTYLNGPTATASANSSIRAILSLNTSTGANFAVYAPPVSKQYTIYNASAYTVTIYNSTVIGNTTAAGSGVSIVAGGMATVWSNGTNFYLQNTDLGTPAHAVLTNATGLPISTGVSGLGSGVATFLGTPSSANLRAAMTDETGSGSLVFADSPALIGTPTAPTAASGTNTTQIATTSFVTTAVAASGLTGEIKMWGTNVAPTGYLLCTGAAVSRTTYASLFAVYGTTFGAGDGSTTFNLPDFRDRMPIGAGTTYSANSQGGSKDSVVVSHTHTATDSGHTHGVAVGANVPIGTGGYYYVPGTGNVQTSTTGNANITVSTTGSSGTNANLPPYLGIYFIVKY